MLFEKNLKKYFTDILDRKKSFTYVSGIFQFIFFWGGGGDQKCFWKNLEKSEKYSKNILDHKKSFT